MISKVLRFQYSKLQQKLIENSLPYIHKYGWSQNAILAACSNMDLSPASHRLIRPYDIISYSMQKWNKNALRIVDDTNFDSQKKIHKKIHFAIRVRLQQQLQYIQTWNQAMAIGASPQNVSQTKNILWNFSDEIWHRCGDRSTDYNYYTKRILFNAAYASTELHLLTDQSPEKRASWEFLTRRLQNILEVGKTVNDLKTVGSAAFQGAWSLLEIMREPKRSQMRKPIQKVNIKQGQEKIKAEK